MEMGCGGDAPQEIIEEIGCGGGEQCVKVNSFDAPQEIIGEIMEIGCGGNVNSFDAPQEIVEKILANLPVKSLMRFKCFSKSWRYLIGTKRFINKHLENSKRRGIAVVNEYCSIIGDVSCWQFNEPNNDDPLEGGWIVGCCNGVLCILNNGHFFLSNPATRILIRLPVFNFIAEAQAVVDYGWIELRCGFGWNEESDAYKVFVCINDGSGVSLGKVYSSKTNSWKKVECGSLSFCGALDHMHVGVLLSGKIHWVPERECDDNDDYVDCIEYFDVKSEMFGRMKLPSEPEGGVGRWWLRERDGCLYALYNHNDDDKGTRRAKRHVRSFFMRARERGEVNFDDWLEANPEEEDKEELFDEWVMEEYGVKESWVKNKTNIPILKSTLEYQRYVYVESLISPACDQRTSLHACDKKN